MNCKTFTRLSYLFVCVLFCITCYYILINDASPSSKKRIENFSNLAASKIQDIQIDADAPLKKKIIFTVDDYEHAIMLHGLSSKIFISEKKGHPSFIEKIASPSLRLENDAIASKYTIQNLNLRAKSGELDLVEHAIVFEDAHLSAVVLDNNRPMPLNLYFQNCKIDKKKHYLLKATQNTLQLDGLKISSNELTYDKNIFQMNNEINVVLENEKDGIQTLKASSLTFDPNKKKIFVFSAPNKPIFIESKKKQLTLVANNLVIDLCNGIKQACIKSDSPVECRSNTSMDKPLKSYFSNASSSFKH